MRVGIIGCAGRMGRALLGEVIGADDLVLGGGLETPGHAALGTDLGLLAGTAPTGLSASDDLDLLLAGCDAVIEFSGPEATIAHAQACARAACAHVIGTTGLSPADENALGEAAKAIPIVYAANMSLGVNLLGNLVRQAAAALGAGWDIEILEMHHRHKVDAPSGTALLLGEAAANGRGVTLEDAAVRVRDGITGPREAGTIGFATLRGGDVVGEHDVVFASAGERVVLRHLATDRRIFARGAVHAARWVGGKPAGLYDMNHVLGLAPAPCAHGEPNP